MREISPCLWATNKIPINLFPKEETKQPTLCFAVCLLSLLMFGWVQPFGLRAALKSQQWTCRCAVDWRSAGFAVASGVFCLLPGFGWCRLRLIHAGERNPSPFTEGLWKFKLNQNSFHRVFWYFSGFVLHVCFGACFCGGWFDRFHPHPEFQIYGLFVVVD